MSEFPILSALRYWSTPENVKPFFLSGRHVMVACLTANRV